MLELDNSARIPIEIVLDPASLNESVYRIQQDLTERFHQPGGQELARGFSEITIDLSILDIRVERITGESVPSWKDKITYPIRLYRTQVILGPLYTPARRDAPCPHCLERRWLSNRPKEEQENYLYAREGSTTGHNPRITSFALEAIWDIMSAAFQRPAVTKPLKSGEYPFYVLNLETEQVSRYHLMQDTACPICRPLQPDTPEDAYLCLESRAKRSASDYRLIKATEYGLPMLGYVNPIAGVLGPGPLPDLSNTLGASVAGQMRVRSKFAVYDAWWGGHGNTYHQSLYLGLLEGIERYAGHMPRGKYVTIFDSYENLASEALDPRECGLYSSNFYLKNGFFCVPFTPDLKMHWVWGYSFHKARPILVPEQLAYYLDYHANRTNFVHECSNGCATGSCMEEAILYGLLELIERDAFLLIWYARLSPRRIDPRSCHRPETLFLLEGLEKCGYELHLLDTRLDIRIPSIVGIAQRKEPGLGNLALAAGASLDPEDAVRSALCEIASYVPGFHSRVESRLPELHEMLHDYSKVKVIHDHALLHGLPEMASQSAFLFANPVVQSLEETYHDWINIGPQNLDLRTDLLFCIDMILQLGMDVIVVDQTCREQVHTGTKTVCVIVPGLLPIDFGWGRERIFDLPRLRTVPRIAGYSETDFEPKPDEVVPHPFP